MNDENIVELLALIYGTVIVYVIPLVVALKRKKRNIAAIVTLNICLGWTIIGWVGALVWALLVEDGPVQTAQPIAPTPADEPAAVAAAGLVGRPGRILG